MSQVFITYFVHGTTVDNENEIATGWNPGELSELGKRQSVDLQKLIASDRFDAIFSSDLKRAVDSASLNFPGKTILRDVRLRECNYGDLNGKPKQFDELDFIIKSFPNGESYKNVEQRMRLFCRYLLENFPEKKIAIVAHQAPQLAFEVIANGKTWEDAIKSDWRRGQPRLWRPGWKYIVTEEMLK